jgi:hypothetical protein
VTHNPVSRACLVIKFRSYTLEPICVTNSCQATALSANDRTSKCVCIKGVTVYVYFHTFAMRENGEKALRCREFSCIATYLRVSRKLSVCYDD